MSTRLQWCLFFALIYQLSFLGKGWALPQSTNSQTVATAELLTDHNSHRYRAGFIDNAPHIDGDLSDPVWEKAEIIRGFTQQEPHFGEQATEDTEVQVVYDREALYIAIYSRDSDPSGIVKNILRFRDDSVWTKDDVVRIMLDTFHDHRRGYAFSINALGTKQDAQIDNQTWLSNWDEVWDVKTQQQEDGWTAEASIPFRILRFPANGNGTWGFNVYRSVKRKNEGSLWSPIPQGQPFSRMEYHGHLEGLTDILPQRNLQIIPYSVLGISRSTGRSAVRSAEFGGDMKISLTPALTLDLTYNTNFSQVEADEQQVNLTRFSLRFPEKREFFLENSSLFQFGRNDTEIFFSRRIGLHDREPVPILGGARLSGRLGAFDIGLISTQTDRHLDSPKTNFSAGRVRWNVGTRSYIGGILTSVASDEQRNMVFGSDALIWLGRNLHWEGFLAAMDDRDVITRPTTYSTALVYDQDLWDINLRTSSVEEGFDPALGYVRRDEVLRHSAWLRRSFRLHQPWTRKLNFFHRMFYTTDQQRTLDSREFGFGVSNQFESGDDLRLEYERTFENLPEDDPFYINERDGILIPPGPYGYSRREIGFKGFDGRSFVPEAEVEWGGFYSGHNTAINLSAAWRASPHLLLEGNYELNRISLREGEFSTHLWRTRISVPFTPSITTDAFLQWNSLDEELITQLRFHLLYGRDSNLFVVLTDLRRNLQAGRIERDQAAQVKLTYRFYK